MDMEGEITLKKSIFLLGVALILVLGGPIMSSISMEGLEQAEM